MEKPRWKPEVGAWGFMPVMILAIHNGGWLTVSHDGIQCMESPDKPFRLDVNLRDCLFPAPDPTAPPVEYVLEAAVDELIERAEEVCPLGTGAEEAGCPCKPDTGDCGETTARCWGRVIEYRARQLRAEREGTDEKA